MAIPNYQQLMLPLLKIAAVGETRVPIAAEKIADDLGLSEEEREELLPSGTQRLLHNRIHWAKFYMSKAGLIDSPRRGVFLASAEGRNLLDRQPSEINVDLLKAYPAYAEFEAKMKRPDESDAEESEDLIADTSTPEEQIDSAHRVLNNTLRSDLLNRILDQTPAFFERIIVELLVAMGYGGTHENAARGLGKSGDGGVDGVIDEDRLGLDRIYVQAKRYAAENLIGRPEIQGFVGSLVGLGASKGVFVTTSTFSRHAKDYANALQQRIILIDGQRLTELMIEFGVGVRVSRIVQVKRLDEDFFEV
ncbi:restriction endonuclease [Altererythrobacter indicus]|uniref:Restriction endonuclease n=1 Tax=Altericroceibacterium indicum TaxID=374177 RepID=A0A845A8N1_9SPHN|nr:restriction endonuclease [Altericroceibacterium indicum]MXP25689.1 restriction endonuclease [Altericroceibacterium indicum]